MGGGVSGAVGRERWVGERLVGVGRGERWGGMELCSLHHNPSCPLPVGGAQRQVRPGDLPHFAGIEPETARLPRVVIRGLGGEALGEEAVGDLGVEGIGEARHAAASKRIV